MDPSAPTPEDVSAPDLTSDLADASDSDSAERRDREARRITGAWAAAAVIVFLIGAGLALAFCFRM